MITRNLMTFTIAFILNSLAAQNQTVGLFINEDEAFDGYVFFSPMTYTSAYLVDNCGYEINIWDRNSRPGLSGYITENGLMLRTNKVQNAQYSQASTGGNLELVDWNNNTLWSSDFNQYAYIQHHDAKLLDNGNIIYIGWERISPTQQAGYGRRPNIISSPDLWGEFISEIKPIGSNDYEVVWEWHLQDHFVQNYNSSLDNYGVISEEIGKVDINYLGPGAWDDDDWWHCNALDYNVELDQILVNSRNNNELWIIDHSTTTEEARGSSGGNSGKGGELLFRWGNPQAYSSGSSFDLRMFGSHGHYWIPDGLPNAGKIMYFNNGDDRPQGYYSTVEMIDPLFQNNAYKKNENNRYFPLEPELVYKAPSPFDFVSDYLSNAQQLPNGNVFINEGRNGRLFEVNEEMDIVWQYISPVNFLGTISQGSSNFYNNIFRAYKYSPEYSGFEGKDLSRGELLEGDSQFNICKGVGLAEENLKDEIDIYFNGTSQALIINQKATKPLLLTVFSMDGQVVLTHRLIERNNEIDFASNPKGLYFARLHEEESNKIVIKKFNN